ncbi:uncharacterized protein LOC129614887 [Condylostylus longicornis]|uniref:uncharacterized protein LOC129614887 n=1 Tax=Condylostylus longicornis TaxID=2530218 RepID=UPI00244E02FB|nr:uncharacterized protein LOC129614887 [Condylostylus longicornis]
MKVSLKTGFMVLIITFAVLKSNDCRYLPTRSEASKLDKLRELMIDVLNSSKAPQDFENDITSNNINTPISNLNDDHLSPLVRNIFDNNNNAKEDSKLLAYLNQYSNHGTALKHHIPRNSFSQRSVKY